MTRREHALAFARNTARLVALLAWAAAAPVGAAICKYIDADGAIHYTNVSPDRGWRKLSCDIADDTPRPKAGSGNGAARSATPAGFPRVEPEAQKSRDELRRKVLADELASEEKLLAEARTAYDNGAPAPLAEEQNDAERYRQRIGRLRQAVQLHERNIEALRKELAAVR